MTDQMPTTMIAAETIEQATRWLTMLAEAQQAGPWKEFAAKHRAFVGFCKVLAADPGAVSVVSELVGPPTPAPEVVDALAAVDKATIDIEEPNSPHTPLFFPPHNDLESRIAKLVGYVRQVPAAQDEVYRASGTFVDRSLKLRHAIDDLLATSTSFDTPRVEAFCVYTFGTLLANTPPKDYGPLLNNTNHIPFYFELLLKAGEAVLNVVRGHQARAPHGAMRRKSEKFGVLDSPPLLAQDLESSPGALGAACVYLDIDDFKTLNTKFSERVVDRDLLPAYQRMLANLAAGIGFAYAEGGDEVTVLLPNATAEMAAAWCLGLRTALGNRLFHIADEKIQLTVSIGVAHVALGGDRSGLPEHANLAMRKAKELGKDCVCMHTESGPVRLRLTLETF